MTQKIRASTISGWRGPVWPIAFRISDGLALAGQQEVADAIREHSLDLIALSGFLILWTG